MALERENEIQPAMSLVELAKQNYREILARDPHHWDARYNLSRALEMLPDVAAVDFEDEVNPERSPRGAAGGPILRGPSMSMSSERVAGAVDFEDEATPEHSPQALRATQSCGSLP